MEIADWLVPHLADFCPYCGSPIVNNENLTDRYCSNPSCPGHMAYKISALATKMGVKDIGPATALDLINTHKLPYHIQYLRFMLKEKPKLYLYQVGELAMIKGHQKKWREYCRGCRTMREVCDDPLVPEAIRSQYPLLHACEEECEVIPMLKGKELRIMLTGSFDGYRARADWVADMNHKYGDTIELVDVGKRKIDVDFLVKEEWATDHEKSAIAAEYGIPVVTPAVMEELLKRYASYNNGGGGDNEDS